MDIKSGLDELNRRREIALQMGGKEKIEKQHSLSRMTARERIEKLLDPGTFMEIGMLEQSQMSDGRERELPAARICGLGEMDGRTVIVHADDHTVLAGTDDTGYVREYMQP